MTHRGGRRRVPRPDPGASSGGCPGNFTDEVTSPSSSSLASTCARGGGGGGGWPESPPTAKTIWPKNGSKQPSSWSTGFGEFSRVLEFKMSVLGLGFYLARKTMFI